MALIVYGAPISPFVRKLVVAIGEKGLAFTNEDVNPFAAPEWFFEISPAKRIPVLRDTDFGTEGVAGTLPDSSVGCLYLERKFPTPSIYPADPYLYGRALWLEEYCDTELAGHVGLNVFRPILFPVMSGKPPDLGRARKGWDEKLPPLFDYLERELAGGPFAVGDSFSVADIAIATHMINAELVVGPIDAKRWPSLSAHTRQISERPSVKDNLARSSAFVRRFLPAPLVL